MSEAAFYGWVLWVWTACAVVTGVVLLAVSAPYGRHARKGWGPGVNGRLGWVVMEAVPPIGFLVCALLGQDGWTPVSLVFLAMWLIHYGYRAFVYPFRMQSPSPVPICVLLPAMAFNAVNSYLNGRGLFHFAAPLPVGWLIDIRFQAGALLFTCGLLINLRADARLRRLRGQPGPRYKIPQGGLFRWVSCPNYLGEIIEWTGWAIAVWHPAGAAFALWTAANLVPRALAHHRWYRERFPDYPASRKALFPGVL